MKSTALLFFAFLIGIPLPAQAPPAGAIAGTGQRLPPRPKSKAEADAFNAIGAAKDPDSSIAAADSLLTNFPDSDYKAVALQVKAESYHQERDDSKAVVYAEQSLTLDAKSFYTLLLLAEIYSQNTRDTDLDKDDRLAKSDKYAHDGLAIVEVTNKPSARLSDGDWNSLKKAQQARAWEALGLSAILRGKYDEASSNLEQSMNLRSDPIEMLRIGRAYASVKRFDDAIAWADKVAASSADDSIKRIAASDKGLAQSRKKQQ